MSPYPPRSGALPFPRFGCLGVVFVGQLGSARATAAYGSTNARVLGVALNGLQVVPRLSPGRSACETGICLPPASRVLEYQVPRNPEKAPLRDALCVHCSPRFAQPDQPAGSGGSELVVFEHLSHGGLHDDPESFNRATLDFLRRQRP